MAMRELFLLQNRARGRGGTIYYFQKEPPLGSLCLPPKERRLSMLEVCEKEIFI